MIRTIWVLGAGAVLTGFYGARVVVRSRFRRTGVECLCDRLGRKWSLALLRMAGARVEVTGLERVDWKRSVIVVANHQSWFDVFALAAHLPGRARFVAKEELARVPIFGRAWQECGHISVDREDRGRARESLERAGQRIREDALAVILFPEGTRSRDGRLQPFKKGAFVLAIQTGVPVVPVGISGSRAIMSKGSFRIRPGEIRLRVGHPIPVDDLEHGDRDRLLHRSREAVAALIQGEDGGRDHRSPAGEDNGTERGGGGA